MKPIVKLLLLPALVTLVWAIAVPTLTIHADAQAAHPVTPVCAYSPVTAQVINKSDQAYYGGWIKKLSGAEPVTVGGQTVTLATRYSPALFNGASKAFDYLEEQVRALDPTDQQVDVESYPAKNSWIGQTWKNLILTIPGKKRPQEVVIMSAHFDSTSGGIQNPPYPASPGADDNASGSASLLEAARLLRDVPLDRTVKLIWFTGEEQWLFGSDAYVNSHDLSGVVGVVNMDMFAYDGDNDRCFEMHVSHLASDPSATASNAVGQCMARAVSDYGLNLKYDYITNGGIYASDHASFWGKGIGAIEVGENFYSSNNTPTGCTGYDENPYYHSVNDTFANMKLPFALDVHKAALATVIDLANGSPKFLYIPLLTNNP